MAKLKRPGLQLSRKIRLEQRVGERPKPVDKKPPFDYRCVKTYKKASCFRRVNNVALVGTERLVVDEKSLADANIGQTNENFKRFFIGKIEENVATTVISIDHLEGGPLDGEILVELGYRAEMKLVYLFELTKNQFAGDFGYLTNGGYPNIAYAVGNDGRWWGLEIMWDSGNKWWIINATYVNIYSARGAGCQVISIDF